MPRQPAYTHEQLIEAAYYVLLKQGPSMPLRAIAARLGVSQPALLKRVGSKHQLLSHILAWATEKTRQLVEDLSQRKPEEGLLQMFRIYAGQVSSPTALSHLLSFSAMCLADPKLRRHLSRRRGILVEGITNVLRRANYSRPAVRARVLVALLDGISVDWATEHSRSFEDMLVESLEFALRVSA